MKFTAHEAQGFAPPVENSALIGWMYALFTVPGFSGFLGVVEISIGRLIAARRL